MRSVRRALALLALVPAVASAQLVRSGTGAGATAARDQFRVDLGGGTAAGANGSFGGVRREINWDGVPDAFSAPNNLPANFFNVNSPRGVVFSTPGTGFQVSANAGVGPTEFDNLNPTYSSTFEPFSPQKLFTALGSNIVDVSFFVPGTGTPAGTRGFGAIFSDVDLASTTSIAYYDVFGNFLGSWFAPELAGSSTFSFLGVSWVDAIVGRVRITSGNAALGPSANDGAGTDVVAMDDFLYGEPAAAAAVVPEPATLALVGTGLALAALLRRRRVA